MNIAAALKLEVARIARKELRGETQSLKKSAVQYRADVAALKKRLLELERAVKAIAKPSKKPAVSVTSEAAPIRNRFSAAGLSNRRKVLGLTASDMGQLIGVSGQTIYKWEQGKATPRASQLPAIRASLKLGKREAAARLQSAA